MKSDQHPIIFHRAQRTSAVLRLSVYIAMCLQPYSPFKNIFDIYSDCFAALSSVSCATHR